MITESSEQLPVTEQANPRTTNLSNLSAAGIVELMNDEDARVAEAVKLVLPNVATTVEEIVKRMQAGGRLFYIGTGTSGPAWSVGRGGMSANFWRAARVGTKV